MDRWDLPWQVSFAMGELKVTPANARHPKCREYSTWITRATWSYADLKLDLRRLKAWECPIAGPTQSTPLSCQFCATQCNLRCDAACQTRTECGSDERTQHPSGGKPSERSRFVAGQNPSPLGGPLGGGV